MDKKFYADIDDENYHSENDESIKEMNDSNETELEPHEEYCPVCGCNKNIMDDICSVCESLT